MTFLIILLAVLLLLLTGTFLPVAAFAFTVVGWLLVVVITITLLVRLFRPITRWFQHRSAVADLRLAIDQRERLGYETTDLDQKLATLIRHGPPDQVQALSFDEAVAARAALDDEAEITTRETKVYRGYLVQRQLFGWCIIKDGMVICSARDEEQAKSTIDKALKIMSEITDQKS